jgi:transposase
MRQTKEILRQKLQLGRSHREVAQSLGVGVGTITSTLARAEQVGLRKWAEVELLTEQALEERLYPSRPPAIRERRAPEWADIHTERKRPGVTLALLHAEYLENCPEGYRYSQFCELYGHWRKRQRLSMRQVHRAGEKTFVDFAGDHPHLVDRKTGAHIDVELFVGVLGASSYTYAEATMTQQSEEFIAAHTRMLEYFGGASAVMVSDQLRSGVSRPCRYEPKVHRTYQEWAEHYGTVVIPARPRKPKDKAKVEAAVLVTERWILARLRNETFFTLAALNARIGELLEDLNTRTMRAYGASRRDLFERLDRPLLKALPAERFAFGEWLTATVSIDYHLAVDHHYYSVPFQFVGQKVDVRLAANTVEIYLRGQRLASYVRSYERGRHTTTPSHMPKAHQAHLEWTPTRFIHWAETIGPQTGALIRVILSDRPHPEQGYRSCLGILRLSKRYSSERLEAACARALTVGARSYRNVDSILKKGLDRVPLRTSPPPQPTIHENIRGADYYR